METQDQIKQQQPRSMREFLLGTLRARPPQAPRLRFSQAGSSCVREVYYRATGAATEPPDDSGLIKMALGSALDAFTLKDDEDWLTHAQRPVEITMGTLRVTGTADLVFIGKDGPELVSDMKVVGDSTWEKVAKSPKDEHRAQVNLYAFGLGAPRWSVCYVHAASGEMREHFGPMDPFAARRDFGLFEETAYWIKKGEPPPRPYEDVEDDDGSIRIARDQWPCRWCRSRRLCWGLPASDDEGEGK